MHFNIKNIKKAFSKAAFAGMVILTAATSVLADGLPGEYYVTQRWRDLFAPHSPATNPALMTEENYVTIRGVWSPSLGEAFFLYEGGVVVPIGLFQSVGVTVLGVTSNEPIRGARWNAATNQIEWTGETFYDNHMMVMASYAINPFNRLSLGANLNYYRTPNFGDAIAGVALDIGATYRITNHPVFGEHIAGINFQNVISPNIARPEGEELSLATQSINAKISWMARLFDRQIDVGVDFDIKDFTSNASNFVRVAVDGEGGGMGVMEQAARAIEFDVSGRVGFWLMRMLNVYGHFGTGFWGVSGGMNVPSIFGGRDFQAAYQYTNIVDDAAAFTHTIYFRGQFGPHREQVFAQRMARQVQLGPGRLYNQMLAEHFAGNFWNSFFIGGRILTEFPDFFRNDYVVYYMGLNLEGMDMRETANESFNQVLSDFPRSPAVPFANLGLLRIAYREGDFSTVATLFGAIDVATSPDSVRQAAAYYQGLVFLAQNRAGDAIRMFNTIPLGHGDYHFAQHSMAVAYAINGDMNRALNHLDNVIQAPATTPAQRAIVERSYLLLAFLYYEGQISDGQSLARAMAALRSIPANSMFRAEALLGQAWVALKAANWADVVSSTNALRNATQDPILLSEADLLLAYRSITERDYAAAITLLSAAENRLNTRQAPTQADLNSRQERYFEDRARYFDIAQRAKELAMVNQSSYVLSQIDSIAPLQRRTENDVRAFGLFKDNHETTLFFGREHDRVLDDVTFALAKAREMQGATGAARAAERLQTLDEQMEELQRRLREMEQQ